MFHSNASRELLRTQLREDRDLRCQDASPSRDVFKKTSAYVTALRKLGCTAPGYETTVLLSSEQYQRDQDEARRVYLSRGYIPVDSESSCQGRLEFGYNGMGDPFIRCELLEY